MSEGETGVGAGRRDPPHTFDKISGGRDAGDQQGGGGLVSWAMAVTWLGRWQSRDARELGPRLRWQTGRTEQPLGETGRWQEGACGGQSGSQWTGCVHGSRVWSLEGAGAGPTARGGPCGTGFQSHHPRACGWVGLCPRTEAVTADTPLCPTLSQVSYMPDRGKLEVFALRDVPSPLGAKLAVLRLFAGYMQQRLREVRAVGPVGWGASGTGRRRGLRPLAGSVLRRRACLRPPSLPAPASACCASLHPSRPCCCSSATAQCR